MKWNLWESLPLVFFYASYSIHLALFLGLDQCKSCGKVDLDLNCVPSRTWHGEKGLWLRVKFISEFQVRLSCFMAENLGNFGWRSGIMICREGRQPWSLNLKAFTWEYTPGRNIVGDGDPCDKMLEEKDGCKSNRKGRSQADFEDVELHLIIHQVRSRAQLILQTWSVGSHHLRMVS